jgi:hypothetical protein
VHKNTVTLHRNKNKRCNIRHNEIYFAHTAGNKKCMNSLLLVANSYKLYIINKIMG